MLNLSAKIRKTFGRKVKGLRRQDVLPAVLYGPKIKNQSLEINSKEFSKIYEQAGESSLISLEVKGLFSGKAGKNLVLIHEVKFDPLTDKPVHVDLYQPSLTEKTEANVPLEFTGESLAVKDLGGTLVKNIHEIEVKALPQDLPHELKVDIEPLKTFEDHILIKDIVLPKGAEILREPNEVVASVSPPKEVEEELAEPIEEKPEEVEKVGEEEEEIEEKTVARKQKTVERTEKGKP